MSRVSLNDALHGRLRFLFDRDMPASIYPLLREQPAGGPESISFGGSPLCGGITKKICAGPRYFPATGTIQAPADFILLGVFAQRLRSGKHQILKVETAWGELLAGMVGWVEGFEPTERLLPLFADAVVSHLLRVGYGNVVDAWHAFYCAAAHSPAMDAIHAEMLARGTVSRRGGPPVVL